MINTLNFIPSKITIGPISIAFYALCILGGALLTYLISRIFIKKKGYDPNAIETLLYLAFPAGILGARLWYVFGLEWGHFKDIIFQWPNFTTGELGFIEIFAIWKGGLAIEGGVLLGVIVGIIFMIKKRPNTPALIAADCIVPAILIAQAIGRWGNFFNQEVFGKDCVDTWTWLPSFITDRLTIEMNAAGTGWVTTSNGYAYLCGSPDQMKLPLFLIESFINTIGFFIIAFAVPALFKWLKKITNGKVRLANGDLMCSYFIWYGTVRTILEPLRESEYEYDISIVMSIFYIIIGVAGVIICHVFEDKLNQKVLQTNVIDSNTENVVNDTPQQEVEEEKVSENEEKPQEEIKEDEKN